MKRKEKFKTYIHINIVYFLMMLVYYKYIGENFNYMAYLKFSNNYIVNKFLLGAVLVEILAGLILFLKDDFTTIIYLIYLYLNLIPSVVFNTFNEISYYSILANVLLLLLLLLSDRVYIKMRRGYLEDNKKIKILASISSIVGIIYFFLYYKYFNFKNLFLQDIYITRALFRKLGNAILGYLFGMTSRVFAPILLVLAIRYKKIKYFILGMVVILILYLSGALKSVFFGMILVLIFYKGNYAEKIKKINRGMFALTIFSIIENELFNKSLITNLIRRVFYVPTYLESKYYIYFKDNFTYGAHSFFKRFFHEVSYEPSISRYFGEKVMGLSGFNANIGVMVDGYISFGNTGLLIYITIITLIFVYLKSLKIDFRYFGVIVLYVYYINTSILSTLLLTHALAIFLIVAYFLKNNKEI